MARSNKARKRQAKRRSHEARVRRHATSQAAKPQTHLPPVGSPEDRAYLERRAQEDLVAFGEFRRARGPWPMLVAVAIGALFAAGIVAWVLLA
jgi:hypothetical protein